MIDRTDIGRGVEYIRETVYKKKDLKRCEKKLFDEFLDKYFMKTWLKRKLIDMFNYNTGEGENWKITVLQINTYMCVCVIELLFT